MYAASLCSYTVYTQLKIASHCKHALCNYVYIASQSQALCRDTQQASSQLHTQLHGLCSCGQQQLASQSHELYSYIYPAIKCKLTLADSYIVTYSVQVAITIAMVPLNYNFKTTCVYMQGNTTQGYIIILFTSRVCVNQVSCSI